MVSLSISCKSESSNVFNYNENNIYIPIDIFKFYSQKQIDFLIYIWFNLKFHAFTFVRCLI